MKYRQLTKEQFESLYSEFAQFLASQQIDVNEWKKIKLEKPNLVTQEMEVFSDMVWDDVLAKTEFVEHFSKTMINLFKCTTSEIFRIVVQVNRTDVDLTTEKGYHWLLNHPTDENIEIFTGKKSYTDDRNLEVFDLIEKGGNISKGELYLFFDKMIK